MRSEAEQACRQRRGSEFLTKTSPTGRSLSLELAPSPYLPTSLIAHQSVSFGAFDFVGAMRDSNRAKYGGANFLLTNIFHHQ